MFVAGYFALLCVDYKTMESLKPKNAKSNTSLSQPFSLE
jgi:hypothetical protein